MTLEKEFEKWLNEALTPFGLNDEVYVNYVQGIMEESTTPVEDKIEGIVDFLSAATETPLGDDFKNSLRDWAGKFKEDQQREQEEKKKKEEEAARIAREKSMNAIKSEEASSSKVELSKEERKKRDKLLALYSYQEERLDENGDILVPVSDEPEQELGIEKNVNALKVAQEDQKKREKMKADHDKKVARDKELREKELEKKEKAKKKTQKQERKGRG